MGNLKTLRGLLVCIAFLERTSTNRVNAQCQDPQYCVQYKFPLVCEGIGKEWYLKNCPKSCKACPADHLSKTYVDTSTATLISSKSTIREERNVTDVNKVPVQSERTTGTARILSATGGAATCLDKAECSKYRIPLDCTRNSWFRQNCQASCNACPSGTSKTTRTSTRKVSSQPRRTTASKRVASVTAWSHPQRTVVTTWIPSPAAVSGACKDDKACTLFNDFHRLCSGTDEWFRQHCRLSCNMCTIDQVSVTREFSQTITTSPVRSRNVSVQVHDDVTFSYAQRTVVTTWIPSPAASSGACKDDNACTRFKDFHRLCSGTDGWYRQHCRLSCNMCITDQVSVTREFSQTSTTSPVKARNVSIQVHDDVSQDMDIDFILATDPVNGSIYKLQGSAFNYSSRLPLVDLRDPLAVDFDDVARRIYWTSYEDKQIFSASLDGRDRRVVFSTGQNSQPYGIAVDGRSRLIFYTDEGTRSIAFVTITTQMHKIIINSSLDKPRAIVLDKENGVIMWSDWGRQPKIEQANYDGSDRYQLVNTSLAYPNGLALDMDNNLLYWSDAGTDKVECLDLEGNIRTVIFQAPVTSHFFGLAVDGLYLYLVDSPGGFMARESHVLRMNRDGTDQQRLFTVDSILYDIHFYTKAAFNRGGSNGCRENNGGCSHICIPTSGNSTRCLCPEGYCESTGFMNCTAACPGA